MARMPMCSMGAVCWL